MPTNRAEPPFRLPFPPRGRRRRNLGGFIHTRTLPSCNCIPTFSISHRFFGLCNMSPRAKFHHIQRTVFTRDEVPAGEENDFAWGGEAEETF